MIALKGGSDKKSWEVEVTGPNRKSIKLTSLNIICSLPPQSLIGLMQRGSGVKESYINRLKKLAKPSGAVVFYGAILRNKLPKDCQRHFQLLSEDLGSLFISISLLFIFLNTSDPKNPLDALNGDG